MIVHVNCAMSADGKIAGPDRKQLRISSDEDMERVKELRKRYDGILVGVGTVVADDPKLTVKGLTYDENPVRIVLDPNGRTPDGALVLNDDASTVIVTSPSCERTWDGAFALRSDMDIAGILEQLETMGIRNILVEGGGETIASFFRAGLVDTFTVFVGSMVIGGRTSPTPADGDGWIAENGARRMRLVSSEVLGDGVLLTYDLR